MSNREGTEPTNALPDHEANAPRNTADVYSLEVGLGHQVRALRTSRGLSVAALAERAGLSKAMLSKIENAQTSCSLTSVAHLAGALDVAVSSLFHDAQVERPVAYTPAGEGTLINGRGTRHNHIYRLLGSFRGQGGTASGPHLEPVLVTLNDRSETYPRFQHPGTEMLYMLDGDMTYRYQDADYRMTSGDTLLLDGEGVHGPTELHQLPIRFLAITAYPEVLPPL